MATNCARRPNGLPLHAERGKLVSVSIMKRTPVHPINPYIRNGFVADLYLNLVRSGRFGWYRRLLEHVLCTQISGTLPERLHVPHPYGILTGRSCKIGEDVTL